MAARKHETGAHATSALAWRSRQ